MIDEVGANERFRNIEFLDFLEALVRIAEIKAVPTRAELLGAGVDDMVQYRVKYEREDGKVWDDWVASRPDPEERRKSAPLSYRLAQVMILFWHTLEEKKLVKRDGASSSALRNA